MAQNIFLNTEMYPPCTSTALEFLCHFVLQILHSRRPRRYTLSLSLLFFRLFHHRLNLPTARILSAVHDDLENRFPAAAHLLLI